MVSLEEFGGPIVDALLGANVEEDGKKERGGDKEENCEEEADDKEADRPGVDPGRDRGGRG